LTSEWDSKGVPHHDGIQSRLIDWSINSTDPDYETTKLRLELGPIGWYDFSTVLEQMKGMSLSDISQYIDLTDVLSTRRINSTRLPNILDTATTLITSDGKFVFSKRSKTVTQLQGYFTTAVAENILFAVDVAHSAESRSSAVFNAVLRGIREELSPNILDIMRARGTKVRMLGISYDLLGHQAGTNFLVVLPLTWDQLIAAVHENPGKTWFEGRIYGLSLASELQEINAICCRPDWTGGGHAGVMRALEFIETMLRDSKKPLLNLLTQL
jgi:hypothetical protein